MSDSRLDTLRVTLAGYPREQWAEYHYDLDRVLTDLPTVPRGTVAQWFRERDGVTVETLQVKRNGDAWLPGPRAIDARHTTYVRLNESRQDYARASVIAADDTALVAHVDPAGFDHVVIYRTVARSDV